MDLFNYMIMQQINIKNLFYLNKIKNYIIGNLLKDIIQKLVKIKDGLLIINNFLFKFGKLLIY